MSSPAEPLQHKLGLDLSRLYSKRKDRKVREPRSAVILDVGGERLLRNSDLRMGVGGETLEM